MRRRAELKWGIEGINHRVVELSEGRENREDKVNWQVVPAVRNESAQEWSVD